MDTLYLEVCVTEDGQQVTTPQTAVVVFVLRYLQAKSFKLCFVRHGAAAEHLMPVPHLGDLDYSFMEPSEVPITMQRCLLPAQVRLDSCLVRCGLGCVLRYIVKTVHQQNPGTDAITLLGYKGICLQSCAETSVWTKFCEVELPVAVSQLESCVSLNSDGMETLMLPIQIIKLENHFHQPPIIPNINRKRKQVMKALQKRKITTQSANTSDTTNTQSATNTPMQDPAGQRENKTPDNFPEHQEGVNTDLPEELQHRFAEGTEMTLADLVLYPCITNILNRCTAIHNKLASKIPKIMEWRRRMECLDKIRAVCPSPATSFLTSQSSVLKTDNAQVVLPEISEECALNIRDPNRRKFKTQVTEVSRILDKLKQKEICPQPRDHPCEDLSIDWEKSDPAVHPAQGDLPAKRVKRKCEQLENMMAAVRHVSKPGDVLVDFCAGGGHVGILAAYLLPECQVVLVENKEESARRAKQRVDILQLKNTTIYQCNMDYFGGSYQVGICLHACGVATDLVMQSCLDNQAAFVICPCCYGKIQETHTISYPRSNLFKENNITSEDCVTLGHAADQTEFSLSMAEQGKLCMQLVDTDRASLAEQHGYHVELCSLKPLTCSPKNNLLIGKYMSASCS